MGHRPELRVSFRVEHGVFIKGDIASGWIVVTQVGERVPGTGIYCSAEDAQEARRVAEVKFMQRHRRFRS